MRSDSMRRRQLGLLLPLLLCAVSRPSAAADWIPIGPADGGFVQSLAFDPSSPAVVYAGLTDGGVAKSVDGGRSWSPSGHGLDGSSTVVALAVQPLDSHRAYAGTTAGLFRSADAGRTWVRSLGERIRAVAVDPAHVLVAYAGTDRGMFRSFNGGGHWTPMGVPPPNERHFSIRALVVAPSRPRTLYAAYFGASSRIYRSVDGGTTWISLIREAFFSLAVDPRDSRTVYAAGRKLLKSTDGGGTWTTILNRPANFVTVDPVHPDTLYTISGGLLQSTDGGVHWTDRSAALTSSLLAVAVDPASPQSVLAGGQGLFRSDDGGVTWTSSRDGLVNSSIQAVAVAPGAEAIFAAGPAGLYRTRNQGQSWSNRLPGLDVLSVAVSPANPTIVLAGADRVYRSADGGDTWEPVLTGLSGEPFRALAFDPTDPGTVYAGCFFPDGSHRCLYRSRDSGNAWSLIVGSSSPMGGVAAVAVDPTDSETVYVAGVRGLFRTFDGGQSWTEVLYAAVPAIRGIPIRGVSLAPSAPRRVAAFDFRSIYLSTNGGTSWAVPGLQWPQLNAVVFDPVDPRILYQGGDRGLFRSLDRGATWSRFDRGFVGEATSFAFDPADPSRLYAGTQSAGVFVIAVRP